MLSTSLAVSGILLAGPGVGAPPHLLREAAAKSETARKFLETQIQQSTSAPPPSGPNHPKLQHCQLLQRYHFGRDTACQIRKMPLALPVPRNTQGPGLRGVLGVA